MAVLTAGSGTGPSGSPSFVRDLNGGGVPERVQGTKKKRRRLRRQVKVVAGRAPSRSLSSRAPLSTRKPPANALRKQARPRSHMAWSKNCYFIYEAALPSSQRRGPSCRTRQSRAALERLLSRRTRRREGVAKQKVPRAQKDRGHRRPLPMCGSQGPQATSGAVAWGAGGDDRRLAKLAGHGTGRRVRWLRFD